MGANRRKSTTGNGGMRRTTKPKTTNQAPVGTLPDLGDPFAEEAAFRVITIEIPIGDMSKTGYITGHVEVNHLSANQKQGLNRLWNGLRESRATLRDREREVNTPADAIRWLLDNIAAAMD